MSGSRPTFVSLFSGAGGLDLGLEQAGWHCAYAADNDPNAVATLKAAQGLDIGYGRFAFDGTTIELADIRELGAAEIRKKCGAVAGSIDLLAGGPPCQSWSSAGHQLGFEDPRGRLFDDFIRVATELDARWLLLENVRGLLTARGADGKPGSALAYIRQRLFRAGYQTTVSLLNAADYGVPQRRVRLFIVGYRVGEAPPFPKATHAKKGDLAGLPFWVPLRHALAVVGRLRPDEIIRPSTNLAAQLAPIPDGQGVKSPGKTERTRPGGHWGYKQGAFIADLNQSARTVTASTQQDWIRDPIIGLRRLAPRECAAIQGFPSGWPLQGKASMLYRLVGNAVPPPVAKALGASLLAHIKSLRHSQEGAFTELLPLPSNLQSAILYTIKEEASNGQSRRTGQTRRVGRSAAVRAGGY